MKITNTGSNFSSAQVYQLLDLSEKALQAGGLDQFAAAVLPTIAVLMQSPTIILYVDEASFSTPFFFRHGTWQYDVCEVERWCSECFKKMSGQSDLQPMQLTPPPTWGISEELMLCPLRTEDECKGLLGYAIKDGTSSFPPEIMEKLLRLIAVAIQQIEERTKIGRQLAQLNSYLTISSMLAQSQGLHEELEVALYSCMELVTAETASVLLLDDEKRNFRFYQVEGPTKQILETAIFPADRGLAGSVLKSQQSEVINDVPHDPRFYGQIDAKSGFQTRNIIVIPLTAGEEQIGVLEILNKADGKDFTEEDHLLLLSITDEIAFAIRNAKVFEYMANSYCKQRQGLASCKGCQRPLGSWTPCVKYQETIV